VEVSLDQAVFRAILDSDTEAFESSVWRFKDNPKKAAEVFAVTHEHEDFIGDSVFFAAFRNQWVFFRKMMTALGDEQGPRMAFSTAQQLLSLRRRSAVVSILQICPLASMESTPMGDTLLHLALRWSRPSLDLVQAVLDASGGRCATMVNSDDETALHTLAKHAVGAIEAKECMQAVIKCRGDLLATDRRGMTPAAVCMHGPVRDLIGNTIKLNNRLRRGHITDDEKRSLSSCDVTKLPPVTPPASPTPTTKKAKVPTEADDEDNEDDDGKKKKKKPAIELPEDEHRCRYGARVLSTDQAATLVSRLYEEQPRELKRKLEKNVTEALERSAPKKKEISQEELQSSIDRLYVTPDAQNEKRDALRSKYIHERPPEVVEKSQRTKEEIAEAAQRLCNGAMQHKLEVSQKLSKTLLADPCPYRQLEKEEQASLAKRLHDTSTEHSRQVNQELWDKYLKGPDGRFAGRTRLPSPERQREIADRLSKPKTKA
jgi:hypothetical protein